MSDTLADLASWLPSEFLTGDMDDKTYFLKHHNPHLVPYDFASSSSTESESDDDDIFGLTRHFTRSVSLQERLKTPYPVETKRIFSGSPESILNWNFTGATQVRSSPAIPFVQPEDDTWDRIYAAAGQVARMKMGMNNVNDNVFVNKGLLGAPRPVGPTLSHHHYHPNCAVRRNVNGEFFRQQLHQRVSGAENYGGSGQCGATGLPVRFRQSACPPLSVEIQRRQPPANCFAVKPVLRGSGGGCGRAAAVKQESAGTGVFIPRSYNNCPPEPKKQPAHLPANKNMDPITAQHQQNIHPSFTPHYQVPHHLKRDELAEMLMARRTAVMLAHHRQQRRRTTTQVGVAEKQMGPPELVLPQEWTY